MLGNVAQQRATLPDVAEHLLDCLNNILRRTATFRAVVQVGCPLK